MSRARAATCGYRGVFGGWPARTQWIEALGLVGLVLRPAAFRRHVPAAGGARAPRDVRAARMPALQERPSDVALLANHWLLRWGHPPLAARETEQLAERRWPGNLRELRRAIDRAAFLAGMEAVTIDGIIEAADSLSPCPSLGREPAGASLAAMEREHIDRVLRECGYRTRVAAGLLGLSAGQLYRKYRALGIAPPRWR